MGAKCNKILLFFDIEGRGRTGDFIHAERAASLPPTGCARHLPRRREARGERKIRTARENALTRWGGADRGGLCARPSNDKARQLSVRCGFGLHALRRSPSPYAHRVLHSLHQALPALVPYPHRNHRALRLRGSVSLCSLRVRPARLTPLGLTTYLQSTAFVASATGGTHSVLHWARAL